MATQTLCAWCFKPLLDAEHAKKHVVEQCKKAPWRAEVESLARNLERALHERNMAVAENTRLLKELKEAQAGRDNWREACRKTEAERDSNDRVVANAENTRLRAALRDAGERFRLVALYDYDDARRYRARQAEAWAREAQTALDEQPQTVADVQRACDATGPASDNAAIRQPGWEPPIRPGALCQRCGGTGGYPVATCARCDGRGVEGRETLAQEHMRRVHGDGSECEDGCDKAVLPELGEALGQGRSGCMKHDTPRPCALCGEVTP